MSPREPGIEVRHKHVVKSDGTVEAVPLTRDELADVAAREREHNAEQAARTKLLSDREAATETLLDAARTDPVAAAVAVLLGLA